MMEETVRIEKGSDWCTLRMACEGVFPKKCLLLGDIRICPDCLLAFCKEEFPEDHEWALSKSKLVHEGACAKVTVDLDGEKVTICPDCTQRVLYEQDPEIFDWVMSMHRDSGHTQSMRSWIYGFPDSHQACRECLLIVLMQTDPAFFGVVVKVEGKRLVERLTVCGCSCHGATIGDGPWHCEKCTQQHLTWAQKPEPTEPKLL